MLQQELLKKVIRPAAFWFFRPLAQTGRLWYNVVQILE